MKTVGENSPFNGNDSGLMWCDTLDLPSSQKYDELDQVKFYLAKLDVVLEKGYAMCKQYVIELDETEEKFEAERENMVNAAKTKLNELQYVLAKRTDELKSVKNDKIALKALNDKFQDFMGSIHESIRNFIDGINGDTNNNIDRENQQEWETVNVPSDESESDEGETEANVGEQQHDQNQDEDQTEENDTTDAEMAVIDVGSSVSTNQADENEKFETAQDMEQNVSNVGSINDAEMRDNKENVEPAGTPMATNEANVSKSMPSPMLVVIPLNNSNSNVANDVEAAANVPTAQQSNDPGTSTVEPATSSEQMVKSFPCFRCPAIFMYEADCRHHMSEHHFIAVSDVIPGNKNKQPGQYVMNPKRKRSILTDDEEEIAGDGVIPRKMNPPKTVAKRPKKNK